MKSTATSVAVLALSLSSISALPQIRDERGLTSRDDSYSWSITEYACPPTAEGCNYSFAISAPAPPNTNAGQPFSATCTGLATEPAQPYAACAPSDGGPAKLVAAVHTDPANSADALVQVSYLYEDTHCQSWNYTGSASVPSANTPAQFTITPTAPLQGFTSTCIQ